MAVNFDRFTLLPDSLLVLIVSFLPIKEAARTSVLSKRWLHVWQPTKNVELNELFFVKSDDSDQTKEAQRQVFLNFIKQWMDNYQGGLVDKFFLKLSNPENVLDIIQGCLSFVTQRGVKELGLDFSDPGWEEDNLDERAALFQLPEHVYGQRSLESLKLFSCGFVMPDLLNFRTLKEVSFGWMEVRICTIKTLLSNGKMIESLTLKKCWNLANFDFGETVLDLRRLVLDKCYFDADYFIITAPKLKFFKYSGFAGIFEIEIGRFVMEEAELDFSLEFEFDDFGHHLYKILEDLYPVRVLTVCSNLLQVVPHGEEPLRVQCGLNVRHLIMKTALHPNEFCGISFLLSSCPMLETLTFEVGRRRIYADYDPPFPVDPDSAWATMIKRCKCVRRTLKVVEVKGFRGTHSENMALHYLVQIARVLEKINISVLKEENGDGDTMKVEMRTAIAKCLMDKVPKASSNLEISIC